MTTRRSSVSSTSYTRFSNARKGRQRPVERRPPTSTASSTRSGVSPKNVVPGSPATPRSYQRVKHSVVRDGERDVGGGHGRRRREHQERRDQARGLTQVSDQARHALDDWRSPRISAQTRPFGVLPFSSTPAVFAGKNVLNTPMGRFMKPGGAFSTNGVMVSAHVITIRSLPATMVSVAGFGGAPARENCAGVIGSVVSANCG